MNRAIVLGDSPFISTVEHILPYALDRFYTVGINRIINKFNVNTHAFVDPFLVNLTNQHPELLTLTLKRYGDLIRKQNKVFYDTFTHSNKEYTKESLKKDGALAWCGFTHDYIISYLIQEGYDDIVLIGAADFIEGPHYSTPHELVCSKRLVTKTKQFIEGLNENVATIRTCNPDSILDIPRIRINELLI